MEANNVNIATEKYTEERLLSELHAPNRKVKYEYYLADRKKHPLGQISVSGGVVSFDSKKSVMRTFKGTVRKSDILSIGDVDCRLTPYMCLMVDGEWIKWPLGVFIVDLSMSGNKNRQTINITGYDNAKIAYDNKSIARFFVPKGAFYSVYISQKLGEDYNDANIAECEKIRANPIEFDIGTRNLDTVNTMLAAIGYNQLHFDASGIPTSEPYVYPQLRDIERTYKVGRDSVIADGVNVSTNAFSVPNRFVRYTESVDSEYMIAVYTNENKQDPFSVPNRGRVITDKGSVSDIASQADLNNYVRMIAAQEMQKTNTIKFSTLNMPGHDFQNCLLLNIEMYGIQGRYIETAWEMDLQPGGLMTHQCEKVVIL